MNSFFAWVHTELQKTDFHALAVHVYEIDSTDMLRLSSEKTRNNTIADVVNRKMIASCAYDADKFNDPLDAIGMPMLTALGARFHLAENWPDSNALDAWREGADTYVIVEFDEIQNYAKPPLLNVDFHDKCRELETALDAFLHELRGINDPDKREDRIDQLKIYARSIKRFIDRSENEKPLPVPKEMTDGFLERLKMVDWVKRSNSLAKTVENVEKILNSLERLFGGTPSI